MIGAAAFAHSNLDADRFRGQSAAKFRHGRKNPRDNPLNRFQSDDEEGVCGQRTGCGRLIRGKLGERLGPTGFGLEEAQKDRVE